MTVYVIGLAAWLGTVMWRISEARYRRLGLACASCGASAIDFRRRLDLVDRFCRKCGGEVFSESAAERTQADRLPSRGEMVARFEDADALSRWEQGFLLAGAGAFCAGLVQASRMEESVGPWTLAACAIAMSAWAYGLDWLRARRMQSLGLRCVTCRAVFAPLTTDEPVVAVMRTGACWYCAVPVFRRDAPENPGTGHAAQLKLRTARK